MTEINLDALDLAELKKLRRDVEKAIENFETRRLLQARDILNAKAQELGVSLLEIATMGKPVRASAVAAKYRNPDDETQTWSGRGRKPKWFADALTSGRTAESLQI